MFKNALKSVVSIASEKETSTTRQTTEMVFDAAFPVKTCSMIDGYGWEGKKGMENKGKGKEG